MSQASEIVLNVVSDVFDPQACDIMHNACELAGILRSHEGERNNYFFSKIQLDGQKYQE